MLLRIVYSAQIQCSACLWYYNNDRPIFEHNSLGILNHGNNFHWKALSWSLPTCMCHSPFHLNKCLQRRQGLLLKGVTLYLLP